MIYLIAPFIGYSTAYLVPEELADGKKWFIAAAVIALGGALLLKINGNSLQSLLALSLGLYILGTLVRTYA